MYSLVADSRQLPTDLMMNPNPNACVIFLVRPTNSWLLVVKNWRQPRENYANMHPCIGLRRAREL